MKNNQRTNEFYENMRRRSMQAAQEQAAAPPLRDILKREYNEAQGRQRNEALEKWGPTIEEMIERDMRRRQQLEQPIPQPIITGSVKYFTLRRSEHALLESNV